MIRTKIIYSEGLYIFKGRVSAGSVLIEDLIEAKKLIELLNNRLSGYVKIYDFLITKDSWTIMCKICDEESILLKYEKQRNLSSKANPLAKLDEIWRIVSEQMRVLLSIFVKYTNRKQGRTGSKVHSNYERYYFETETEAEQYMNLMKNQELDDSQRLTRYNGKKGLYKISRRIAQGHVYLCTKQVTNGTYSELFGVGSLQIVDNFRDVLRKLIKSTYKLYLTPIPPS